MRPGFKRQSARIGDPCANVGCAGHYRRLTSAERDEYTGAHPHALRVNSHLEIGECDACGMDVIGLDPREEAPTTASA